MSDDFSIVDPNEIAAESFHTCDVSVRKLTERLGATEMRVNQVVLEPGEVTTPHTHDGQEEVFVAMTDAQIAIDDEVHHVSEGGVVRAEPETVRNFVNNTDEKIHVWIAIGSPPVGTVDDFGAYVVSDDTS